MTRMMKQFYISFCNGDSEFKEREYIDQDFCGDDAAGNYILRRYIWVSKHKSLEDFGAACRRMSESLSRCE